MIIDEILDAYAFDNKLDIDYIKKQADFFGFDYVTKAIKTKKPDTLKAALKLYLHFNNYDLNIGKKIDKLKIDFVRGVK